MREVMSKVYTFDELDDSAKERAREWWRECENQDFGGFGELYEPAKTAAKMLGIEFATRPIPLYSGGTRYEPKIFWSGFSSQGDGASWEGTYSYHKGCAKEIREEFPTDTRLHAIADGLTELQKQHGYGLTAKISIGSGHYVHKHMMDAEVYIRDNEADSDTTETLLELARDFAEWIYRGLEAEYEYRMSDENVDDSIRANEYEFTIEGKIV